MLTTLILGFVFFFFTSFPKKWMGIIRNIDLYMANLIFGIGRLK